IQKTGKTLPDLLASLLPFQIRRLRIEDGTLGLQERGADAETLKAHVTAIDLDAHNLTNTPALAGTSYATGQLNAQVMKSGHFNLGLKLDPTAKQPAFTIRAELRNVDLTEWNTLLRWQWGIDAKQGTFAMFTEATAREGA